MPGKKASATKGGSSVDAERERAFEKLCEYLEENEECQFSFEHLQSMFLQLSPKVESYSEKHLKRKLVQRYGNSLTFASFPGKRNIMCFSGTTDCILSDNWYKNRNKESEFQEELRIIKTTAAIIRREIKSKSYDCTQFPTIEQISKGGDELVPEILNVLITEIIEPITKRQTPKKVEKKKDNNKRKITTICHNIITAVRPRSFMSPIQLGAGVSFHRKRCERLHTNSIITPR